MNQIQILTTFKRTLLQFIDELINIFTNEKDLVVIKFFIDGQVPMFDVIEHTYKHLYPLLHLIRERNDTFFLENQVLFEDIRSTDKVTHFKRLWLSGILTDEDKEVMWKWFEAIISLSKKYFEG